MNDKFIITNNLFMDRIVDFLKDLVLNSVLKNQEEGDKNESIESIKAADLYISCVENRTTLYSFETIPKSILERSMIPSNIINDCYANKDNIPEEYRNTVVEKMNKYVIDNYTETNNYYRNLNGLPNINEQGIYIDVIIDGVDNSKPVHLMNNEEVRLLETNNIIRDLISEYSDKRYLRHLGERKISYYKSRKAPRFGIIYCPYIESDSILNKFKELLEVNRIYTLKTIYSDAFKYNSDYYDNFIELFIKVQTAIDMINDVPEIVVRRDFFDSDSIRDMFLSHGIDYFPEIPLRYQIAMIKNLNNLLKYKSTTRNIIDIYNIFGFSNIEIFKYYLLKDRQVDIDENYIDPIYEEVDGKYVYNDSSVYDLKFVKVPVDGIADDYIRNPINHLNYDSVVIGDEYWNREYDHNDIKNEIINLEFNYILSKYLSVDTVYDMSSLSFDLTYFFNMVFDNRELEENLRVPIGKITYNKTFRLTDILCMLYVLTYENIGIEDTILDTSSKILYVTGFNFKSDLSALYSDLISEGYDPELLGIDGFIVPEGEILTFNELIKIYINNEKIYNHVIKKMFGANDIHMYRIYKKIYDALMISELNTSMFKDRDGNFAGTYTNYLKDRDDLLYDTIINIRTMEGQEKITRISELIDDIILSLEEYLNVGTFEFSFSKITTVSSELIKDYIYKIINFFKSHTVQFLSANVIYKLDNRVSNKVMIIDDVIRATFYDYKTPSRHHSVYSDRIHIMTKELLKKTNMEIYDNIYIFRTYN